MASSLSWVARGNALLTVFGWPEAAAAVANEVGMLNEPMLGDLLPKTVEQRSEDRKSLLLSVLTMMISIPALIGA